MSIRIESERLTLREITEADLPRIVEIAGQAHILRWCEDWADCGAWVHSWHKGIAWRYGIGNPNVEFILLGIEEKATGRLIGQVNTGREFMEQLPGELSVGYYIAEEALGNGYAAEAVRALTAHYFPINPNGFFYAVIQPGNAASIRVAQKAGFVLEREMDLPVDDPPGVIHFGYWRLYGRGECPQING